MKPMKEKKILVVTKRPGEEPQIQALFPNDLASLQNFVGGYIETVTLAAGVVLVCNEEGRLQGLAPNVCLQGQTFVGPVLVAGTHLDEFTSLPGSRVARVLRALEAGDIRV